MILPLKTSLVLITTLLFITAVFINSCAFSAGRCKKLLIGSMSKSYDIVIIPGCPYEKPDWNFIMKSRVYWAKYLYDKGIVKNIMFSGNAVYTEYCEGEIMALYAEALGIPKEHIFTETKAEHSTENLYYSYKKSRKLGFTIIALASDPFQTKLLKSYAIKKMKANIGLIPFVYDTLKAMQPKMIDPVINDQEALIKDFISITKRENIWQRLKGTLGNSIDTNAYK